MCLAVVFMVHATRLAVGQGLDPAIFGTTTSLGTRGSGVGQFEGPAGIFVDSAWRIYVTDARNSRLVRLNDIAGSGWTTFGAHGTGINQFLFPWGVFVTPAGQIFVTDVHRVVRMNDMSGSGWTTFGTPGTEVNQFMGLVGIVVSSSGQIYVADKDNNRIVRIDDMTGRGWIALGSDGAGINRLTRPRDIYVNSSGHIFVNHEGFAVRVKDMVGTGWTDLRSNEFWEGERRGPWLWSWPITAAFVSPAYQVFSVSYPRNHIVRYVPPFLPPPVLSPSDLAVRAQPPAVPQMRIVSPSEEDPDIGQDLAAAYEGPLGDFIVTRDRAADQPPCRMPYRPTENYRNAELYSPAWGRVVVAYVCPDDGKVVAIWVTGLPWSPTELSPNKHYFVGPARVPIAAPLWRLKTLTVAGKPAIVQTPIRRGREFMRFGFQIAVIERFPSGTEPGILYRAAGAGLEETIATAARLLSRE